MLGRHHDRSRAVNSVDARSEHTNLLLAVFDSEVDECTFTTTDPVALSLQNFLRPGVFDLFYVGDELFRVVSDAQKPLFQITLLNSGAAAPADPTRRLLVREHSLFFRTPVDLRGLFICEAAIEHLQKEPLVPLVIIGTVRGDLARPVVTDTETLHLPAHVHDV